MTSSAGGTISKCRTTCVSVSTTTVTPTLSLLGHSLPALLLPFIHSSALHPIPRFSDNSSPMSSGRAFSEKPSSAFSGGRNARPGDRSPKTLRRSTDCSQQQQQQQQLLLQRKHQPQSSQLLPEAIVIAPPFGDKLVATPDGLYELSPGNGQDTYGAKFRSPGAHSVAEEMASPSSCFIRVGGADRYRGLLER